MRLPLAFDVSSRTNSTSKDARIVNAYVNTEGNKKQIIKRPGTSLFTDLPLGGGHLTGNVQGFGSFRGTNKLYAIVDRVLYEISSNGAYVSKGTVGDDGIYTFTETSQFPYLFIQGASFAYTLTGAGVFSQVTDSNFPTIAVSPGASFTGAVGAKFTASISGTVMTVTAVASGYISSFSTDIISGAGIPAGLHITSSGTGTGGTGTYNLNLSLSVPSQAMTITSDVLNVTSVSSGTILPGQSITGSGMVPCYVLYQLFGTSGSTGQYKVNTQQLTDSISMGIGAKAAQTLVPFSVYMNDTVFVMTNTGKIYNSAVEDPTSWNVLNYISKTSEPDGGVALIKHLSYLLAFGEWSGEFFYYAGNATGSPLSVNDTAKMEIGCVAGTTAVQFTTNQTVLWVGQSKETGRGVYELQGLAPKKISTKAIDQFLNSQTTLVGNCIAYAITISGHPLYILSFIAQNVTFVYDLHERVWTQWTSDNGSGVEGYFKGFFSTSAFYKSYVLFGNGVSGSRIVSIEPSVYQDAGVSINFRVVTPKLDMETNKNKFLHDVTIIGDTFTSSGTISIRFSDDDYTTWSSYRTVDMTKKKPILYQLGYFKRRAFDIWSTANQPIRLEEIELNVSEGTL